MKTYKPVLTISVLLAGALFLQTNLLRAQSPAAVTIINTSFNSGYSAIVRNSAGHVIHQGHASMATRGRHRRYRGTSSYIQPTQGRVVIPANVLQPGSRIYFGPTRYLRAEDAWGKTITIDYGARQWRIVAPGGLSLSG